MANPMRRYFITYEKMANKSLKFLYMIIYLSYALLGAMAVHIFTDIFFRGNLSSKWNLISTVIGAALGALVGGILVKRSKNVTGRFGELELSEGYTDETLSEAYKLLDKSRSNIWKMSYAGMIGNIHNFRGEFGKTAELLSRMDDSVFSVSPTNAQMYYSALLMAYLILGERDRAVEIYDRGAYYMRTYMNSPVSGAYVSLSFGVYEYYAGRFETSLQLLDNSLRTATVDATPKQRIPTENMVSIISYWKAVVFANMGNKTAALEIIEKSKELYKTPYYEMLFAKLSENMAENEKERMR